LGYFNIFFSGGNLDSNHVHWLQAIESFVMYYVRTYDFIFMTSKIYDPRGDELRPTEAGLQKRAADEIEKYLQSHNVNYLTLPAENAADICIRAIKTRHEMINQTESKIVSTDV